MALEAAVTGAIIKVLFDLGIKIYDEMPEFKVDDQLKQLFFNATKAYFQNYSDRHGQVQVLGMSKPVSLDAIYSGARMLDTESMKSYDSREALEEAYRNRGDRRFRHHNCPKRNGIDIANECERLIVLGDPGIGKSTFLRKVGLEALKGEQGSYKHPQIPVFLELKLLTSPDLDLEACIAAEFENCGFPHPDGFTKKALAKGRLLILFDGLDEVPAENLDNVIQKIQAFVDRYSKNRFIASCRIAAYHTYFKRVTTVAIAEFDDEQIEKFITNWFSSELDQQSQTAQHCWELLQKPENKGAKELAQSPLLLTFLCMVYNKSLTVPSSRTTLYGKALDIILEEWASEKRVGRGQIYEGFHSDLEKQLLAKIAYQGFENNQLFFSKEQLMKSITDFLGDSLGAPKNLDASAVLKAIEVQQGIFVERATNVYSFSHLTLQEFLTAKYIVKWNLLDDLVELHRSSQRWREVFFLVTGLMGEAAIGLLEKLEVQTQGLSDNPKLQGLLIWANTKTNFSTRIFPGEIRRIFAVILILTFIHFINKFYAVSHILDSIHNRKIAKEISFNRKIAKEISLALALALDLALAFNLDLNKIYTRNSILNHDIASALASERKLDLRDLGNDYPLNCILLLDRTKFALEKQLLKKVDLQPLVSYLETAVNKAGSSAIKLTSVISSSLDISPECLDLSIDDVKVIINYFSTSQLMIDCSKQASGISAQQWDSIKQRMFLPTREPR